MRRNQLHRVFVIVTGLVVLAGCGKSDAPSKPAASDGKQSASYTEKAGSTSPSPEWVKKLPKDWPQIVLTNDAKFKGHSGLKGASAFLIEGPKGATLLATALHLIGEAGGVEPAIPVNKLDAAIESWKAHPRTEPDKAIEADKVAVAGLDRKNADWLVLTTKKPAGGLPATALRLRANPVQVGEKVFLIGCPYSEPNCKQNVYEGKVTKRAFGDSFQYTLSPPVDLRGFSGAPIVDSQGYVVGVMTIWFDRAMEDGKDTLGGGQDAAFVADLLKGK